MTTGADHTVTIPARVTARELAKLIEIDVTEVLATLDARGELDTPEDVLDAALAVAVAKTLGVEVTVESRDLILEALYEHETKGETTESVSSRAERLTRGVLSERQALDEMIESVSKHWSVARMPVIDRNILRLGLYELRHGETPTPVIISEAVRLAQTYSTEKSSSFVNGVLASLANLVRSE